MPKGRSWIRWSGYTNKVLEQRLSTQNQALATTLLKSVADQPYRLGTRQAHPQAHLRPRRQLYISQVRVQTAACGWTALPKYRPPQVSMFVFILSGVFGV
jgi:hypothetical protein